MEVRGQFDAPAAVNRTAGLGATLGGLVNIYRPFERMRCLHKHRCVKSIPGKFS